MAQPRVVNALNVPYPVTVEVHFDQSMLNDGELTNVNNYLFDHGAFAREIEIIDDKQVRLIMENLFEYDSFTVTVTDSVKNLGGEGVDPLYNSATFSISRPEIPGFALAITATNGRLKSGVNSLAVDEDELNWYIMTESGIDVVNKTSLTNIGFILDAYGFTTITVSRE
jgi:hypothetical protein